jgi:hypothetical protein
MIVLASGGLTACSLLVGTSGLTGGDPTDASTPDGGDVVATDGPPAVDAPSTTDSGADVARPCTATTPFGAPTRVPSLSTPGAENGVTLSPDELTAIVGRAPDGGASGALYAATRAAITDDFGSASAVDGVALPDNEATPTLSPDGETLFFGVGFNGNYNLRVATRPGASGTFSAPTTVDAVDVAGQTSDPFVTATSLWYIVHTATTGWDIFRAPRVGSGVTGGTLDQSLSSTTDDVGPVATADELTVYFASHRTPSTGGYDIFYATRTSATAAFATPVHADELDTAADEVPRWMSADGCAIYFISNRTGGAGFGDVYVARRSPP